MNNKCKVLICDDHAEFRELVKAMLKRDPRIDILGEAADGKEVVDKALRLRPDVVLMDLNMPQITGLEATRRIRRASKRIKVLMVSAFRGEDVVSPCLDAGASGYFEKYRPLTELSQAIDTVRKGGKYLSPGVLEKVSGAHDAMFF
jgi:DNA-binding NarL/FixJ family response regulator